MASVLQLLRDMIAIPSVNPMRVNSGEFVEEGMANFVETILSRAGIDCQRQRRSQQQVLGFEKEVAGANYGTDGSKLSRAGIQTVVCGPGNIAQAHTATEFIEIKQVELATRIYGHMLSTWHEQQG